MKNYSELIRDKNKRILSAKGYKFVWRCIDIVANQNNINRYSKELKPVKEKLKNIFDYLIIDKELSLDEIKLIIKNRNINNIKISK